MSSAEILRKTRVDKGLNQAELARRAGTSQTYISRIERGMVSPSLSTLERLMHAMGKRLTVGVESLSPGNVSPRELRADFRNLTSAERVEQAMELSAFLTGLAVSASRVGSDGSR